MDYKDNILVGELFDIYSNLLTKKQKEVFVDYYFNNLSLSEIAENNNISRQAVDFTLKNVIKALNVYEDSLGVRKKNNAVIESLISLKSDLNDISFDDKINNIISKIKE